MEAAAAAPSQQTTLVQPNDKVNPAAAKYRCFQFPSARPLGLNRWLGVADDLSRKRDEARAEYDGGQQEEGGDDGMA